MLRQLPPALALFFLSACGITDGAICTTSVEPGIIVIVEDSTTGLPAAASVNGVLIEGLYTDSLTPYGSDGHGNITSLAGAYERGGNYAVLLQAPNYYSWTRGGIRVLAGSCHVHTITLTARLRPAP
jgi:hypothetical protein